MSFKQYIAKRQARDNPEGDFVRDARADGALPDVQNWAALKAYLEGNGACDGALVAARSVWRAYCTTKPRLSRNA
jgi:hypothetical protein